MSHTITLVSAVSGDHVGRAVELAELDRPAWTGRPEVLGFMQANGYGPDSPAELMYVLAEDEDAPEGFPVLRVDIGEAELAEIRAAFVERAAQEGPSLSTLLILISAAPGSIVLNGRGVEIARLDETDLADRPEARSLAGDECAVHESGSGYARDVLYAAVPTHEGELEELIERGLLARAIAVSEADVRAVLAAG